MIRHSLAHHLYAVHPIEAFRTVVQEMPDKVRKAGAIVRRTLPVLRRGAGPAFKPLGWLRTTEILDVRWPRLGKAPQDSAFAPLTLQVSGRKCRIQTSHFYPLMRQLNEREVGTEI